LDVTHKILFVCLGNICRSPSAEAVFRDLAGQAGMDVVVDGAGTSDWHIGEPPDRRAQRAAAARGYDLSGLRGRQVSAEDFDRFDLILAMDRSNLANLQATRPPGARAEIKLFMDFAPDQPVREVPDPYYDNRFDHVLDLLEQSSRGLIAALRSA
jgi:protein-tyrosine phosphatase